MKIEIWSDIMCPFCYIGKRRLERALVDLNLKDQVEIQWKSFLLNPDLVSDPKKGMVDSLSESKGWSKEQTEQILQQVTEMAATENLAFDFSQAKVANTMKAHRLLQYSKSEGKGNEMKEALLSAYFIEGKNVDSDEELLMLSENIGLDKTLVQQFLTTDGMSQEVMKDVDESQEIGVRGVPFFVVDRKYGISGAQPVEAFVETLQKALLDENNSNLRQSSDANASCDVNEGNC